jgi:cytochrome P450
MRPQRATAMCPRSGPRRDKDSSVSVGLQSVPRAPGAVPLLGHALKLWRDPLGFLKSLRGSGDLVQVNLGTMPVYMVTSAELVHEVTVRQARHFEKGRLFDRLRPLAGNGLATANGEVHRRHRRLIQPMFHPQRISMYAEIMSDNARALTDSWTPGQHVEMEQAMAGYAVETLAKTLFSTDIGLPAVEAVRKNLPVVLKNMLKRAASPKILDRLPIRANRDFDAAAANQLVAEIEEVVGDRPVTIEDVPKLEAVRRVLDEVIRLHGVTLLMRRAIEEVELGGFTFPAGTEVAFSLYAMHRDPGLYDDPDRFDPDRWLPERRAEISRQAYVPFGAGNRKCIGDAFVWTEATIALATILARWQLRPVPGHTPKEVASAVAHPDRVPMMAVARNT